MQNNQNTQISSYGLTLNEIFWIYTKELYKKHFKKHKSRL